MGGRPRQFHVSSEGDTHKHQSLAMFAPLTLPDFQTSVTSVMDETSAWLTSGLAAFDAKLPAGEFTFAWWRKEVRKFDSRSRTVGYTLHVDVERETESDRWLSEGNQLFLYGGSALVHCIGSFAFVKEVIVFHNVWKVNYINIQGTIFDRCWLLTTRKWLIMRLFREKLNEGLCF